MARYMTPRKTPPRFPNVDEAIKAKGTVAQFIRESGLHLMTYYAMQSGRSSPTLDTVYAVLKYTGLNFEEAFGVEQ